MDNGDIIGALACIVIGAIVIALLWGACVQSDRELTDEYNQIAQQQGWEPLTYNSHVDSDDVRRAILAAKMHLKPTAETILNAPKRPVNNYVYVSGGRR